MLVSTCAVMLFFHICVFLLARNIYAISSKISYKRSDVAIVLGAAVWGDSPSPVFAERINHAINLYHKGIVDNIIFTGGIGKDDFLSESEVAKEYAIKEGVLPKDIFTENNSHFTEQNLVGACQIMKNYGFTKALVVSDPLHMRRSVTMALDMGIDAQPSPTPTTRYRTWRTKIPFLLYEAYFYRIYIIQRSLSLNNDQCHL